MLEKFKKEANFKKWYLLATYIIVLAGLVLNFEKILAHFLDFVWVFKPLFYALGFAFIINIPMDLIEKFMKKHLSEHNFLYKKMRPIALSLAIIFVVVILSLLIVVIVPKLVSTLLMLINDLSSIITAVINNADAILEFFNIPFRLSDLESVVNLTNIRWDEVLSSVISFLGLTTSGVVNIVTKFGSTILFWFTGFILSLYLVAKKEEHILQLRQLLAVVLGVPRAKQLFYISHRANIVFKSFVTGQLLEAVVLSCLYYVLLLIFRMPFAELIAALIGVTTLLPVVGPTIGVSVGAFLILAKSPVTAIWFVIMYQVVQQFDNSFIYPRIVGSQVGLPGIWVLLSIFIFGDLFGIFGMLIAVPTTAFIYMLLGEFIKENLALKRIKVTLNDVIDIDQAANSENI